MTITQRGIIVATEPSLGYDAGDYALPREIQLRASWHSLALFCAGAVRERQRPVSRRRGIGEWLKLKVTA
jgi:hypothetical protein